MKPRIRVSGADQMAATLRRQSQAVRRRTQAALVAEAQSVLAESQRRVPVETGELRASGMVVPPRGDDLNVEIVFTAPHAVFVHEDLDAVHPDGRAKFLESTLLESASSLADQIARRARLEEL